MSQLWLSVKAEQCDRADAHVARIMAAVGADLRTIRTPRSKSEMVIDGWLDKAAANVGRFVDSVYGSQRKEEVVE